MGNLRQIRAPFGVCAKSRNYCSASAVWAAVIVPLLATIAAQPAGAQTVAPPDQTVTGPVTITLPGARACVAGDHRRYHHDHCGALHDRDVNAAKTFGAVG